MELGLRGEVVDFYQKFRRGYPTAVIDALVEALRLGKDAIVVDIDCGTGQLTLPMAGRVGVAVGVDPEPDMLARARRVRRARGRQPMSTGCSGPTPMCRLWARYWANGRWVLWLGHENIATSQIYLNADMTQKERAIERTRPPNTKPGRYRPPDPILAFLEAL